ncbi:MAG: alpha/beta hydrolase-fold protein [Robinsoniella sp.]|nr:alpha/beta hydrolase-fold protein [Robinsoniella sp.]
MKRKIVSTLLPMTAIVISTVLAPVAVASAEEVAEAGVVTEANADSKTGFTTTFTYVDENATNVQLMGGFQFYVKDDPKVYANGFTLAAADSINNYLYGPEDWENGLDLCHIYDAGYVTDMIQDEETGEWTYSLDLPGGSYLYQYKVSYDGGETYEAIADPANIPECNAGGAHQTRSKFYVPYDAEKQDEMYDWSWLTPVEDEAARGTIEYSTYEGSLGREQNVEVYLPAGYDPDREEPYKVLYLSHGGGGEEGDWFHQGNATNIVDRLIAAGETEEFLMVTMNNAEYIIEGTRDWDFEKIFDNTKNYLMPYIEENYNVSTEVEDRAYAGLSNGAKTTTMLYYMDPTLFGYYGMFSGSAAWAWPELEDYSDMQQPNIYLAAGFADHLMMQNTYHTDGDKTLIGFKELLDNAGITYNNGGAYVTVQGGHDWFTWPQILKDYVETTLWK